MEIEYLYNLFLNSTGVSTDTRQINDGNIFFALKGPSFNGNLYAADALKRGATLAVIDDVTFAINDNYIVVDDTLQYLQQLAHFHRKVRAIPVIAICGSNGKTTTKELVYNVLATERNVFATPGNFNNHIGVPLSLLRIKNDTDIAIIEIGANHLGETADLCTIAAPDYGVITNNGYDHLEGYGTIDNVRKANGELYDYLAMTNGRAFVNADDVELMKMSTHLNRITYGSDADMQGSIISNYPFLTFALRNHKEEAVVETHLAGDYNMPNILCAAAIGSYFGISLDNIQKGIAAYYPKNNRSQLIKRDSNTYIIDCYNANPSSMEAALNYFNSIPGENKVVILGDMFELGDMADALHQQILILTRGLHFNKVVLSGPLFSKACQNLGYDFITFNTTAEVKEWYIHQIFTDTLFLLKASRAMALENIII